MDAVARWVVSFWDPVDIGRDIQHVRVCGLFSPASSLRHSLTNRAAKQGRQRREQRILRLLDRIGFSWRVYSVAFLGFLASSWSLIAVGIVSPALYFVYDPTGRMSSDAGQILDLVTLTATVLGMLLFGQLADLFGRKALYGFELLIVLAAIGGAAFSSEGYMAKDSTYHSMDIYASLTWWRFTLGFGIGAEYPMSAVIAAEFSSTAGRGSLLAAVFLAQAIGRLLAYGLGLGVLHGMEHAVYVSDPIQNHMLIMDKFWRLVLGLAGIPAIFAIVLRLFIPETPRFYSAVQRDLVKAREAVMKVGSRSPSLSAPDMESLRSEVDEGEAREQDPWRRRAFAYFFGKTQGWKPLLAVSLQWLLLDVVFYGTGLDSPGTLAALWLDSPPNPEIDTNPPAGFHVWKEDYAHPNATIVETLENNLVRTLQLSSVAAVVGSLAVIPLVNYVSRKTHYVWTTAALTILFAVTAVSVSQTYGTPAHKASMVFYALGQFMFNLGPNTLTFILAAESFPTEFRGTCYGIAAAAGKVGAIIVRPITETVGKSENSLVGMLSAFSGVLALMTLLAWLEPFGIGFPRVQEPRDKNAPFPTRLVNLSLEEAAPWPVLDDAESDRTGNEETNHVNGDTEHGGQEKGAAGVAAGPLGEPEPGHGGVEWSPDFQLLPEPSVAIDREIRP
jgi:PHS family inorganic phosphate transporter-like MFS transporter